MIYKQTIDIPSYLCDDQDRLHTWAAVRLCQEVTEYHGNATGIGFKTLLEKNLAWVIVRALYNVYRLPDAFEKVEFSTWSRGNNGLIACRDYRVTASDSGEVLLTGTSQWPLIDMTTRRALRLHDVVAHYENHDIQATEHESLGKLKIPPMTQDDIILTYPANYAMIDHTRHVNNSEYIKLLFNCLHTLSFDSQKPFCLEINYQLESRLDEQLTVYHRFDGAHYFQITNPRGQSVTAKVTEI